MPARYCAVVRLYSSTSALNDSRSKWSPESSTTVLASPASRARIACWTSWMPEAPPLPSSISQRGRTPSFHARSMARSGVSVKEATPSPSTSSRWMPVASSTRTKASASKDSVVVPSGGWRLYGDSAAPTITAFARSTTAPALQGSVRASAARQGRAHRRYMLAKRMHGVVLLKQILDWELPPSTFRIDPETKRPPDGLGPTLLGPFEQNALELALQLKDAGALERVTALLAGPADAAESLRMGSVMDRMAANRKPITRWTPDELGLPPDRLAAARRVELEEVWVPQVERSCELIEGEDPGEVAAALLGRLEELKLLTRPA